MVDIGIAITTYSGYERPEVPFHADGRVRCLLSTICQDCFSKEIEISVFDDGSNNYKGQQALKNVCDSFNVKYYCSPVWKGISGNYNFACSNMHHKWIAVLSDDTIFSKGAIEPMLYFLENNQDKKIASAGWSVVNAFDLVKDGFLVSLESFYTAFPSWMSKIDLNKLSNRPEQGTWECHKFPVLCRWSSGPALVVNRNIWEKKGGFFEKVLCFEEDFCDWVWNHTDYFCVNIASPPIYHLVNGSTIGLHEDADCYKNNAANWALRLGGVGETFDNRGTKALKKIESIGQVTFKYLSWIRETT